MDILSRRDDYSRNMHRLARLALRITRGRSQYTPSYKRNARFRTAEAGRYDQQFRAADGGCGSCGRRGSRRRAGDMTGIRDRSRGPAIGENAPREKSHIPKAPNVPCRLTDRRTDTPDLLFADLTRRYSGGNVRRVTCRFTETNPNSRKSKRRRRKVTVIIFR